MADEKTTPRLDAMTRAVLALTRHGIRPDIQELLVYGDPLSNVRPGALQAAIAASGTVVCRHEPYQGRCAHCDVAFKDGRPVS